MAEEVVDPGIYDSSQVWPADSGVVVEAQREVRLGGAANVCHMLRGLEAEVTCAGVVGAALLAGAR